MWKKLDANFTSAWFFYDLTNDLADLSILFQNPEHMTDCLLNRVVVTLVCHMS